MSKNLVKIHIIAKIGRIIVHKQAMVIGNDGYFRYEPSEKFSLAMSVINKVNLVLN